MSTPVLPTATYAAKGSQRWLQAAVNLAPHTLDQPLSQALRLDEQHTIEWLSPRADDHFREHRDGDMLRHLGCKLEKRTLENFWPARGAMWDGLARTSRGDLLLVEAKGHVAEMLSGRTRAEGESLAKIQAALRETQQALAPHSVGIVDWSQAFYQYTNRLAHLYLMREVNGLPAHLVFVYFLNADDVEGPSQQAEWLGAIKIVEGYLGLRQHRIARYVHKIFLDVADLPVPPAGIDLPLAGS